MANQGMIEVLEKENTFLRGEAEEWRIKFQHSEDTIALLEKQIKEAAKLNNRLFRANQHLEERIKNLREYECLTRENH